MAKKKEKIEIIQKVGPTKQLKDTEDLPFLEKQKIFMEIRKLMLDGYGLTDLYKILDGKGFTDKEFQKNLIQNVTRHFEQNIIRSTYVMDTIAVHTNKYEQIYREVTKLHLHSLARKAMYMKEKILGLRGEGITMEINQQNNLIIEDTESNQYNLKKLTETERSRFEELMQKVRVI